jgi:hypothetical protein
MVLVQFVITYNDALNSATKFGNGTTVTAVAAGDPSVTACTVLRNVALNSGEYIVSVVGCEIASGTVNTTSYAFQPQILTITSPQFTFPASATNGLTFTNNGQFSQSDIQGPREFMCSVGVGNISLSLSIAQFGTFTLGQAVAPYIYDKTQTWLTSGFAYLILSLDFKNCDNKALFGNAK